MGKITRFEFGVGTRNIIIDEELLPEDANPMLIVMLVSAIAQIGDMEVVEVFMKNYFETTSGSSLQIVKIGPRRIRLVESYLFILEEK